MPLVKPLRSAAAPQPAAPSSWLAVVLSLAVIGGAWTHGYYVGSVPAIPAPAPVPPTPPAPPAPIPAPGLHVLIVYHAAEASKLSAGQEAILFGQQVRAYLLAKCAVGPDGKTKEFRIWDQGANAAGESALWQAALARPRTSTPWLVVSNGATGYEGPLPANVADALALLKKYGGD